MESYALKAKGILTKVVEKMRYGVTEAQKGEFIPYSVKDGKWAESGITWWTNGFWPAEMWQMYFETGDEFFRNEAVRAEKLMDKALEKFEGLHHDVGFMWLINSGVRYAVENNDDSLRRVLFAGNMLAGRYNPNGFIRAWNMDRYGWSIIDTMMNLPLLYSMSELTKDPRFALMAKTHALTAAKNFYKPDGSVYHIIIYDPETGKMLETPAGQGCAPGSSWSRGQSWALYGFTLSYLYTGDKRLLEAALRSAEFFAKNTPEDGLVPVDFCQSAEPHIIDNCANGIAACGFIELSKILKDEDPAASKKYLDLAAKLTFALDEKCADYTTASPAILTHCTGSYMDEKSHHIAMNYGDSFFIEALRKLAGETKLIWKPLDFKK